MDCEENMDREKLVIIGAGGFSREIFWLVEDINSVYGEWDIIGCIDDDISKKGSMVNHIPILGDMSWFENTLSPVCAAIAVGDSVGRKKIADKVMALSHVSFPNLIHPSVRLSKYVSMGHGNIVCCSSVLTVNITMESFNIINLNCTIGHDVSMGSFCTLAPSVNISGNVRLEDGCSLGTNCCIIPHKSVGGWSVIGAGAVVTSDIAPMCTAVGVPAKEIKNSYAGGELI